MNYHKVKCSNFEIANNKPFTLIAGPCQLESEEHALKISTELKKLQMNCNLKLLTSSNMKSYLFWDSMTLIKGVPILPPRKTFNFALFNNL